MLAVALAGCSSSSSSTADAAATNSIQAGDSATLNACLNYAPTGASCKTGGVCGVGEVNDTDYLCTSSIEICCVPAKALGIDAGLVAFPDGSFVKFPDAAKDATGIVTDSGSEDAGHDEVHDAGVDATKPAEAGVKHDAGKHD